jgi:8-oxo-dGTP pyrophosphatase MutT (NUDIX family)
MKLFLNDRSIEFLTVLPGEIAPGSLITEYRTAAELSGTWEDFYRYEKHRRLLIIDPLFTGPESSGSFKAFAEMFKNVPAAGGLIINESGEYLFIHRLGHWDLPKGKIEKGDIPTPGLCRNDPETARVAALREIREETGLKKVKILHELPSTWHIYEEKGKRILKRTRWFAMEASSAQPLKPATNEGIFLVKWTSQRQIHCILSHTYASIRELLLEVLF